MRKKNGSTSDHPVDILHILFISWNHFEFIKEGTTSFIIDCEVVAYDREKGKILPFQDLSHRKRKGVKEVSIQVCLYCFDVLYINGRSLLREHLGVGRDLLHSSFIKKDGTFHFADYKDRLRNCFHELVAFFLSKYELPRCKK